jgi:hypothetical protein
MLSSSRILTITIGSIRRDTEINSFSTTIFCVLTEFCGGNKMATLTVSIPDDLKKDIFERYINPVDELPLKESFVKELEKARDEPSGKSMTL